MNTFAPLSAALLTLAAAMILTAHTPAHAAGLDGTNRLSAVAQLKASNANDASRTSSVSAKTAPATITGGTFHLPPKNGIAQLTSSDCRLAGGTVVVPGDDRCGSIGATYCRYPDTNAACITER